MLKILKLESRVRLSELGSTISNVLEAYTNSNITKDIPLQSVINELIAINTTFSSTIAISEMVSQLESYEEIGDTVTKGIYYYLQSCVHLPTSAISLAAEKLLIELKKHGLGASKFSFNEETIHFKSLLESLSSKHHANEINSIPNLKTMVEKLVTTQQDYQDLHNKYLSIQNKKQNKQSASDIKYELLKVLNDKLVIYLRSQIIFNQEVYLNFAQEVASAINKTNNDIKKRSNLNKKIPEFRL